MKSLYENDELVGPLVGFFVQRLPDQVAALQFAQERSDYSEIEQKAHQMAGSAGGYGFPEVGVVAKKIEIQAREHVSPDLIAKSIEAFRSLCEAIVKESKSN